MLPAQKFDIYVSIRLQSSNSNVLRWLFWLGFTAREYLCHRWSPICSFFRSQYLVIFISVISYHWIFIQSNTTGVISGTRTAFLSGAHEFTYSI